MIKVLQNFSQNQKTLIVGGCGLVLIMVGLFATYQLTKVNQDLRQQAKIDNYNETECQGNSDCPNGTQCKTGMCVNVSNTCSNDSHCAKNAEKKSCVNGICSYYNGGCKFNRDCGLDQTCENKNSLGYGTCTNPKIPCESASDCAAGQICNNEGKCQKTVPITEIPALKVIDACKASYTSNKSSKLFSQEVIASDSNACGECNADKSQSWNCNEHDSAGNLVMCYYCDPKCNNKTADPCHLDCSPCKNDRDCAPGQIEVTATPPSTATKPPTNKTPVPNKTSTPKPNQSPTPTPVTSGPMCNLIQMLDSTGVNVILQTTADSTYQAGTLKKGTQVKFKCGANNPTLVNNYEFRVVNLNNQTQITLIPPVSAGSPLSQNYVLPSSGDYLAQCRICEIVKSASSTETKVTCHDWEPLPGAAEVACGKAGGTWGTTQPTCPPGEYCIMSVNIPTCICKGTKTWDPTTLTCLNK